MELYKFQVLLDEAAECNSADKILDHLRTVISGGKTSLNQANFISHLNSQITLRNRRHNTNYSLLEVIEFFQAKDVQNTSAEELGHMLDIIAHILITTVVRYEKEAINFVMNEEGSSFNYNFSGEESGPLWEVYQGIRDLGLRIKTKREMFEMDQTDTAGRYKLSTMVSRIKQACRQLLQNTKKD